MERPARLCGLWALLLCAGGGGVAAPTGECGRGPGAAAEGAAGVAADRGRGLRRGKAPGGGGGAVLTTPGDRSLRRPV